MSSTGFWLVSLWESWFVSSERVEKIPLFISKHCYYVSPPPSPSHSHTNTLWNKNTSCSGVISNKTLTASNEIQMMCVPSRPQFLSCSHSQYSFPRQPPWSNLHLNVRERAFVDNYQQITWSGREEATARALFGRVMHSKGSLKKNSPPKKLKSKKPTCYSYIINWYYLILK